jgi:hypothetical protein
MPVSALGYVVARTKDLSDWASFGPGLLGLQRVDKSRTSLAFRMDDRKKQAVYFNSFFAFISSISSPFGVP